MSLRLKELYKNKNNGNKEIADFTLKRTWSVDISKLTVKSRKIPNKNNTNKQTNVWMLSVVVLFQWSVFLLCRNFDSKKEKTSASHWKMNLHESCPILNIALIHIRPIRTSLKSVHMNLTSLFRIPLLLEQFHRSTNIIVTSIWDRNLDKSVDSIRNERLKSCWVGMELS